MIQASELRIGNWLKREAQPEGFLVDAGTISRISHSGVRDEEPIPLTEEWLIRFGFEKICDDVYSIPLPNGNGVDLVLEWGECCVKRNHVGKEKKQGDKNPYDYAYIKALKHVHQLQNLYHALTGSELEVK
jgi:hypothetical protein